MDATAVDPVTRTLTGTFPAMVLLAALLSYPVARALLRLYHRSVARSMQSASGTAKDEPPPAPAVESPPAAPLTILDLSAPSGPGDGGSYLLKAPARAAVVYAVAGAFNR